MYNICSVGLSEHGVPNGTQFLWMTFPDQNRYGRRLGKVMLRLLKARAVAEPLSLVRRSKAANLLYLTNIN